MTLSQAYKALAALFGVLALVTLYLFLRMRWAPHADFDVTGFLWIASNLGRMTALFFVIVFLGIAIRYWVKSWRG